MQKAALKMYRNQYLITAEKTETKHAEMTTLPFQGLHIHRHATLNVSTATHGATAIALLGYLINPLDPGETNDEAIARLARTCPTAHSFFKEIQTCGGRYVLLYKNNDAFYVTGDACHLRQIYFGFIHDAPVLTSSPRLFLDAFNLEPQINPEKQAFLDLPLYEQQENTWYGFQSVDDRLDKLLPNHFLDLEARAAKRLPLFRFKEAPDEAAVVEYAASLLRGTFESLARRYPLIQSLTAGWDSRVLLAASKEVRDRIQYYVFDRSDGDAADTRIARRLSARFGLSFRVARPEPLREDFVAACSNEHLFPRILPKTANIQYHFDQGYAPDVVNVNGNGAEVARCYYGHTNQKISLDMLLVFSGYHKQSAFVEEQLARWYEGALPFAREHRIALLDLFYWEQRMGHWGAQYPFEQDMAVEEISPFNNRSLLYALLGVSPRRRKAPHYLFFQHLIRHLWAETLLEPINPDAKPYKKVTSGSSMLRYLALKTQALLTHS